MKRRDKTNYVMDDAVIYEFKKTYFVLEMCQQGKEINPNHAHTHQLPSDITALLAALPMPCTANDLGAATLKALNEFDTRGHPFDKFDFPARNKYIAGLMGGRGLPSLLKNARIVHATRDIASGTYKIIPTFPDLHISEQIDAMERAKLCLPAGTSAADIGEGVLRMFAISTYDPERKDPHFNT